jgi:pimeloyl-ACP methyl ester carboxylesterase
MQTRSRWQLNRDPSPSPLPTRRSRICADDWRGCDIRTRPPASPGPTAPMSAICSGLSNIGARPLIGGPRKRGSMPSRNTRCRCAASTSISCTCPAKGRRRARFCCCTGGRGSLSEFLELIPRLSDPARFRGDPADAFTVVAPSLPGYGLSFTPGQPRFGIEEIADCVTELMRNTLGYTRFAVQGGDWGAITASRLGYAHADKLIGIHVNLLAVRRDQQPAADAPPEEKAYAEQLAQWLREETGYQWIRGTRPQTLAFGLTDSPVSPPGSSRSFARGRIAVAMSSRRSATTGCWPISASTGLLAQSARHSGPITRGCIAHGPFLREVRSTSRRDMPNFRVRSCVRRARWRRTYRDTRLWSVMPRGGHFAALEQPEALAREIREFFRPLRG